MEKKPILVVGSIDDQARTAFAKELADHPVIVIDENTPIDMIDGRDRGVDIVMNQAKPIDLATIQMALPPRQGLGKHHNSKTSDVKKNRAKNKKARKQRKRK